MQFVLLVSLAKNGSLLLDQFVVISPISFFKSAKE